MVFSEKLYMDKMTHSYNFMYSVLGRLN